MNQAPTANKPVFRHTFQAAPSPDMIVRRAGVDPGVYVIRSGVNQQERKPLNIPGGSTGPVIFWIDAPLDAECRILLYCVNGLGEHSKAIAFDWKVTGKRIIRAPGTPFDALSMTDVRALAEADESFMVAGRHVPQGQDYVAVKDDQCGQIFKKGAVGVIIRTETDDVGEPMVFAMFPPFDMVNGDPHGEGVNIRFYENSPNVVHTRDRRQITIADYLKENPPVKAVAGTIGCGCNGVGCGHCPDPTQPKAA